MTKLIFRKLYIFSSPERKAKVIAFAEGSTLVTSDALVGTDRGKSVILRSLYHAMGADAKFTDMWEDKKKSYILMFSVGEADYYIYRSDRLFKVLIKILISLLMLSIAKILLLSCMVYLILL